MFERLASIARSRARMSVISAGLTWRFIFVTWRFSLRQRHLALAVADDQLVDRSLGGDPLVLGALGGHQRLEPVRVALADQDDPRGPDDPMHDVLLTVEGDHLVGAPPPLQHAEHRGRGTRLALHLGELGLRRPPTEHDEGGQDADHDPRDDVQDQPGRRDQPEERHPDRRREEEDREQDQPDLRVALLGDAVRLLQLADAARLAGALLAGLGHGSCLFTSGADSAPREEPGHCLRSAPQADAAAAAVPRRSIACR